MHQTPPIFSVITPTRGNRPKALAQAIGSVEVAVKELTRQFPDTQNPVEMFVGFDGVKGHRPSAPGYVKFMDFPHEGDFGNTIRNMFIHIAKGHCLIFLDDDNALLPNAFTSYYPHIHNEMIIARIDTSRAFETPTIPVPQKILIRQGNIDPLCLCLNRNLVINLGRGWQNEGGYESDFLNIRRYARRARTTVELTDIVGIYDAGAGLDEDGMNQRQKKVAAVRK